MEYLEKFNNTNEEMMEFLEERLSEEDFKHFQGLLITRDVFKMLYKRSFEGE